MELDAKLEAIMFAAAKPFTLKRLAELSGASADDVRSAVRNLSTRLEESGGGLMLQENGHEVELVTRPEVAELVSTVVKAEAAGELTRPSLEALTILAYRGPLTRPELEQIRGVQSALILRNLMIRGLVEEKEDSRLGQPTYAVTFEFLNHLGVPSVEALPDYSELRGHQAVADILADMESESTQLKAQL
jgi:segregation and condensation protein B